MADATDDNMGKGYTIMLILGGMVLCFTILGAVLGIPMIAWGWYRWRKYGYGDE